jgi:hypothetical protein
MGKFEGSSLSNNFSLALQKREPIVIVTTAVSSFQKDRQQVMYSTEQIARVLRMMI